MDGTDLCPIKFSLKNKICNNIHWFVKNMFCYYLFMSSPVVRHGMIFSMASRETGLCRFGNIAPPGGVARAFEIMFNGIGKDIGFTFAIFLRVLL